MNNMVILTALVILATIGLSVQYSPFIFAAFIFCWGFAEILSRMVGLMPFTKWVISMLKSKQ